MFAVLTRISDPVLIVTSTELCAHQLAVAVFGIIMPFVIVLPTSAWSTNNHVCPGKRVSGWISKIICVFHDTSNPLFTGVGTLPE
jgi:hypothetical protein